MAKQHHTPPPPPIRVEAPVPGCDHPDTAPKDRTGYPLLLGSWAKAVHDRPDFGRVEFSGEVVGVIRVADTPLCRDSGKVLVYLRPRGCSVGRVAHLEHVRVTRRPASVKAAEHRELYSDEKEA